MKSYNSNKATASANQPRWFAIAVILIMAMQIIILCEGSIIERSLKHDTYYYSKAAKTKAAKTVSYQTKSAKNVHQSMMIEYTTKAGKDEIGVYSKSSKANVDFHHAHSMSMGGVSYEAKAAKTKAAKGDSYFSFFHHGSTDGALDVELNATVVNATTNTTDEATTGTTTDAVLSDTTDAVVSDRAPLNAGSEDDGSSSGGQVLSRRNFISFLASSVSALFFLICM
jgi:hypothetical protein